MLPKGEILEKFKTAYVRDANAGILYLIEDTLPVMMTRGPDDRELYGVSRMAAMLQAMVD